MKPDNKQTVSNPLASQPFLRSNQTTPNIATAAHHPVKPSGIADVTRLVPNALLNAAFENKAADMLKSVPVFVALAIEIDHPVQDSETDPPGPAADSVRAVADAIQKTCTANRGLWGIIDFQTFACFFADCHATEGRGLADQIKQQLSVAGTGTTVTIGTAGYPTLDYPKNQILENACKALEHARFFAPDATVAFDAVSLNISGDTRYESGDIRGAIEEFQSALQLDPSNDNVHNSLGVCYGMLGEYPRALEEFEATLTLKPSETFAIYNAGLAHKLMGSHQKALSYFLKAQDLDPDLFEAVYQTGRLYSEMKMPEKGIACLQKAIRLNPGSSVAYAYLGECNVALKQYKAAMSAFKTAIKKNAGDTVALSGLGWLYHRLEKNPEIALLFCQQSVDIDPNNGLNRFRLGQLLAKHGRWDQALIEYEKAARLGFDSKGAIETLRRQRDRKVPESMRRQTQTGRIKN